MTGPRAGERVPPALWPALALLVTCLAYLGTVSFEFVYDDHALIVENPLIRSWHSVPQYFTTFLGSNVQQAGSYYRPLLLLWLRVNYALFGLNSAAWHASTLLLHLLATWLVWVLGRKLGADPTTAAVAALLFGIHPLHVESVAWVMGFVDPLVSAFVLAAFILYLRAPDGKHGSLALSLACFAAGLLTKEIAAVLPLLVFAHRVFFGQETRRLRLGKAFRASLPYLGVLAVYLAVRAAVLHGVPPGGTNVAPQVVLLTAPAVLLFYIRHLVMPAGLSAFYDTPYVLTPGWTTFVLPLLLILATVAALGWWHRRSGSPLLGLAAVWIAAPILPALNLSVFPPGEIAHDRYLYLSSVGFCLLAAMALRTLAALDARVQWATVALLAAVLLALTVRQTTYWANDLLLYYRGISLAPHNTLARNNLGNALEARGMPEAAIQQYKAALAHDPNYWLAAYNLGYTYWKLGRYQEAEPVLARAAALNPADADGLYYLGQSALKAGKLYEAVAALREAARLSPRMVGVHGALGSALRQQGKRAAALEAFREELRVNPGDAEARRQISEMERSPH